MVVEGLVLKKIFFGYILMLLLYYFLSKDIDWSDFASFMRRMLFAFLLATIPLYFSSSQSIKPIILCGFINMVTFPLINCLTNHRENISYNFPYDFAFGLYIIAFLASMQLLIQGFLPNNLVIIIMSSFEILLLSIPMVEIIYYGYYGENISLYSALAVLSTDRREVKEYFKNINTLTLTLNLLILVGIFMLVIYTNHSFLYSRNVSNKVLGIILVTFFFSGHYLWLGNKALYRKTGIYVIYSAAKDYYDKSKVFLAQHERKYNNLKVKSNLERQQFGTVIVVIGESANRLHMPAFSEYQRETTPWLSEQQKKAGFFLFSNAYSSWAQTVPVLEMALTEKNQYNNVGFSEAYSFIDMAKKIGFKTCWYSNQGYAGNDDTPISLVATTADKSRWVVQDYKAVQYDEVLLDYLKGVSSGQNNFVVLHLKGSHSNFHNRYPKGFAQWKGHGKQKIVDDYDNTILYTDFVLSKIHEYATENLNLQSMIYFSDHGIEVKKKRMPGFIGFENLRIPLFIYLSETYRKKFPEIAKTLASNARSYFTNDLIYDLICGILQIKSDHNSAQFDISSSMYSFTKSKLRTNLGKTALEEDPYQQTIES